jgi:hypothetical protein
MNDLGFDLLMNPKKKQNSSDSASISSKSSLLERIRNDDDNISVKSVNINPQFVENRFSSAKEESESELSYEVASTENSEEFIQQKKQKNKTNRSNYKGFNEPETESEYSIPQEKKRMSEEDILKEKQEMLYQFDRLEKKGIKLPRKFTLASSLEEMRTEYERLKRDKEVDASVKFQRRMVMAFASGVEFLNDKFDPFDVKLSGWSEKVHEDIDDYDEVFEELHEKYKSKAKVAPELKLIFMMGSSAFMFHLTNSMFKSSLPGLDQVLKQNPELMKQFAAATANTMAKQQKQSGGAFGGLASMFGSMFGGGNNNNNEDRSPQNEPQVSSNKMRGPTNVDDILEELNGDSNDNDRIEMMSAVTESDIFDIQDDTSSINGLIMGASKSSKKKIGKKNKITLDL